jgi:DNA-binding GntR family transcriptional regulator
MNKRKRLPLEFDQIPRPRSLNDIAYEGLKENILKGKLLAGEIYSELELARTLGISRTPVREALIRLSADHLIAFHPRKGISVNYFNKEDIENLFELRQIIECAVATKIKGLSREQIQIMQKLVADQEADLRESGGDAFFELDRKFHLFFIESCGNRFMVQTNNNLRNYIATSSRSALMQKGRPEEVVREHHAIVEAISAGSVGKTVETVKIHLHNSKLAALESYENNLKLRETQ